VKKKQKESSIKSLIKNFSIETTPSVYTKYGNFTKFLNHKNDVYVTFLPDEKYQKVVDTSKKLNEEGFRAIPHLPARTFENNSNLEKYIGNLSEKAGCKNILVIGGGASQIGNINSSLEVLQSDLLSKYNFEKVGLACHPEGHPNITKDILDKVIIEKNKFSKNTDFKLYFITQFFFEAKSFKLWEQHIYELGNKLEIHAGIAGPATLKTLISFAKSCGIMNSFRFLSKQALNITKIAATKTPDKLIADLAEYKFMNPASKLTKLHLYPFGGMKKTSQWMNTILDNHLKFKNSHGFEIL